MSSRNNNKGRKKNVRFVRADSINLTIDKKEKKPLSLTRRVS